MHQYGNAPFRRLLQHGAAHVAARADGDVGAKLFEDLRRLCACRNGVHRRFDVFHHVLRGELALKPLHLDRFERIARFGHQGGLHTSFGTDEQDLGVGTFFFYLGGDAERGVDVPRRAATCH